MLPLMARPILPRLLVLGAMAWAATGLSRTFGEPFQRGWLGHNGARYGQIARNYERNGLTHLRGAPLLDAAGPGMGRPDVYAHHPPALPITIALVRRALGDGWVRAEDAARLVPAAATLGALLLLAILVGHVGGPWAGGLAALAAASMPMVNVYGAHVDVQGAPVLCLSLAVILGYRRWVLGRGVGPLLVAAALASAFDWNGLYAPAGCAVHLYFTRPGRRRAALGLAGFVALLFAAWVVWLAALPETSVSDVFGAASKRGVGVLLAGGDALRTHASAWVSDTLDLMPGWPALLVLALLVAAGRLVGEGRDAILGPRALVGLLLLAPLAHAIVFPAGLLAHDYWLFALPPALAAAFALSVSRLRLGVGLVAAGLLLAAGQAPAERVLAKAVNSIPFLLGQALAEQTAPGEVVLTNYDTNPLVDGGYVLKLPEVLYYSDRIVRGGIAGPERLESALQRYPDAAWFLLTPWPMAPSEPLRTAVQDRAAGPPLELSGDPPVWLIRLRPDGR